MAANELSFGRRIFAWSVFPVTLTAALLCAYAVFARTGDLTAAFLVPTVATAGLVTGLERIFPYRAEWNRSHGDVPTDVAHFFSVQATSLLVEVALLAALVPASAWLARAYGSELWPTALPLAVQLVAALVIAEFPKYWIHRWMHETDLLWRFHAVHHSVPRLYWFNAYRFHPVDIGIDSIVGLGTLALLGAGVEVLALFAVVTAVHGFFQHSNLELRLGPLNYFFSMAELHRWHHSRVVEEANHNYGNNVIVWDIVFGTRFLPSDREPPTDLGLSGLSAYPMDFAGQLASPFRWRRIARDSGESP